MSQTQQSYALGTLTEALIALTDVQLEMNSNAVAQHLFGIALHKEQYYLLAFPLKDKNVGICDHLPGVFFAKKAFYVSARGKIGVEILSQSFRQLAENGFWEWIPLMEPASTQA
jgi:hypothetical protein